MDSGNDRVFIPKEARKRQKNKDEDRKKYFQEARFVNLITLIYLLINRLINY